MESGTLYISGAGVVLYLSYFEPISRFRAVIGTSGTFPLINTPIEKVPQYAFDSLSGLPRLNKKLNFHMVTGN